MDKEQNPSTSAIQKLKRYFGFANLNDFRKEWSELSDEDKEWFKTEILKLFPE